MISELDGSNHRLLVTLLDELGPVAHRPSEHAAIYEIELVGKGP